MSLMKFNSPLIPGTLIRRYQRFKVDVRLEDGQQVTAHCPNPGSLLSCNQPGRPVLLSRSTNPKRKLAYTWEMIRMDAGWVGINTNIPNRLVYDAILDGEVPDLSGYEYIRREVPYGKNSRIDIWLKKGANLCFVEIKNVTLVEDGIAYFPDAVTTRGTKHLRELMGIVRQGQRGVMFYLVQRGDGKILKPADHIDPVYGQTLREAHGKEVEILVYRAVVTPEEISLGPRLPYEL